MPSIIYRGLNKAETEHSVKVSVSYGYDENGEQQRIFRTLKYPAHLSKKTVMASAKRDAYKLEEDFKSGKVTSEKDMKFPEFTEYFLNNFCRGKLSVSTVVSYEGMIEQWILPEFKGKKVAQIHPTDINKFITHLNKAVSPHNRKKLSTKTIRNIIACLSSMMQQAVYSQLISINPCSRVRLPSVKKEEQKFLTDSQVYQLMEFTKDEDIKYRTILYIAVYSGLRRGEITGLYWSDIDFENKTISVNRTRKYIKGVGCIDKDTKTKASHRTMQLPDEVFSMLAKNRLEQNKRKVELGADWVDSPHVFKQWNGAPMSDDTPYQWLMKVIDRIRACQKESDPSIDDSNLFPIIRFHDLRHTNASLLMSLGIDIQTIRKRLGHAQASTTLNMYGHALDQLDQAASIALEIAINKV